MIDFGSIKAMTFDCYGTLIDWEAGIVNALGPLFRSRGAGTFHDPTLLKEYANAEAREERRSYRSYRRVLGRVSRVLAARFCATLQPGDDEVLANSVKHWPAFPDTPAALEQLAKRFRLVVLSNIDRDLFAETRRHLGPAPLELISAEDVRSYKPGPAHFEAALRLTGLPAPNICHVAQSLYHDIGIARSLGFRTVWVNRRGRKPGGGATPSAPTATPDMRVSTLQELADAVSGRS